MPEPLVLRYQEWGLACAPPLVLLHGFASDGRTWRPLAERLAPAWRVIAPDLPGHGASPPPPRGCDLPAAAEALGHLLERVGARAPLVLGYSLGGRLALHLALARPLAGLVLVGASPGLADPAARAARVEADERWIALLDEGLPAFRAAWEAQPLFAGRRLPPEAERVRATQDAAGLAAALAAFGLGRQAPLEARLGELDMPVVLVAGEHDAKFRAIAQAMAARIPRAITITAPGAGHDVPLERPEALLGAIAAIAPVPALKGATP